MKIMASCLAMAACLAGASAASAGTSTVTRQATFTVASQCAITGATVNLGTYRSTDTVLTVGKQTGYIDEVTNSFVMGTNGAGTVPMGSVTCDSGTPYSVSIVGNGEFGDISLTVGNGKMYFYPMVSKVGTTTFTDTPFGYYTNPRWNSNQPAILSTGTGARQDILGNVIAWVGTAGTGYLPGTSQLGAVGVYTSPMTYTLNF